MARYVITLADAEADRLDVWLAAHPVMLRDLAGTQPSWRPLSIQRQNRQEGTQ